MFYCAGVSLQTFDIGISVPKTPASLPIWEKKMQAVFGATNISPYPAITNEVKLIFNFHIKLIVSITSFKEKLRRFCLYNSILSHYFR
jgi:hypothetical protein